MVDLVLAPLRLGVDVPVDPPPGLKALRVRHVAEDLPDPADQINVEEGTNETNNNRTKSAYIKSKFELDLEAGIKPRFMQGKYMQFIYK